MARTASHRIEIKLRDINQLFNTMDPSPFREKDLDADAEEFIVSWAQEFPRRDSLCLTIHLSPGEGAMLPDALVEQAVRHYFAYRKDLIRMEFGRLMRDGRLSLLIGLAFLSVCLTASGLLRSKSTPFDVVREGLEIVGWVAMWRPLEIYLYEWWPLLRRLNIYEKMSRIHVEVVRQG